MAATSRFHSAWRHPAGMFLLLVGCLFVGSVQADTERAQLTLLLCQPDMLVCQTESSVCVSSRYSNAASWTGAICTQMCSVSALVSTMSHICNYAIQAWLISREILQD